MITIWTMEGCFGCEMSKELLKEAGIAYNEKKLGHDFRLQALKEATGSTQLPQFFKDDKHLGGVNIITDNIKGIKETFS